MADIVAKVENRTTPKISRKLTRLTIDLIEADLLGIGRRRIQSDRTGNEGKAQKAFPVGTRGHSNTPTQM
jgi:hypothetical protein